MSFRDIEKFSMQATSLRPNDHGLEEDNVFTSSECRLLKAKAIYGANGSGKSNICEAIGAFVMGVVSSVSNETVFKSIWDDRFKLIMDWDDQEIFFQYTFLLNNTFYKYGFTVLNEQISKEWLFENKNKETIEFFIRNEMDLKITEKNFPGSGIYMEEAFKKSNELFRKDSLFLTAAALNGNKFASSLRDEIRNLLIIDGANDRLAQKLALDRLETGSAEQISAFKKLLIATDTGIEDIQIRYENKLGAEKAIKDNSSISRKMLFSVHSKYDNEGISKEKITVPFDMWESEGTKKLFGLTALVLDALENGKTLIIDEFDARFHPNLTLHIVKLFHDIKTNPNNGQLIFVTHDAGLLWRAQLRRDQICLVNKDRFGLSTLKSLIEFKGVRKDASYEKEYLNGTYGAIPYLDEMGRAIIEKFDTDGL